MPQTSLPAVERAAQIVLERAHGLRLSIEDYYYRDYNNDSLRRLFKSLMEACDALAQRAQEELEEAREYGEQPVLLLPSLVTLKQLAEVFRSLHSYMMLFQEADVFSIPHNLSECLNRRVRQSAGEVSLFFSAWARYMYSHASLGVMISELLEGAGIEIDLDSSFGILLFPRSERDNVLLGALVAHEIGHHIYRASALKTRIYELADEAGDRALAADCIKRVVAPDYKGRLVLTDEENIRIRAAWDIVENWMDELAADRVAVYLVGPAFLIAFSDFIGSISHNIRTCDPEHPSSAYRMAEIWRWLSATTWKPYLEQIKSLVPWLDEALADGLFDQHTLNTASDDAEAMLAVTKLLTPHVRAAVDEVFVGQILDEQAANFGKCAVAGLELLSAGAPPGEAFSPEDATSIAIRDSTILICGWSFLLGEIEEQWAQAVEGLPVAMRRGRLAQLLNERLAKALEISVLRETWT